MLSPAFPFLSFSFLVNKESGYSAYVVISYFQNALTRVRNGIYKCNGCKLGKQPTCDACFFRSVGSSGIKDIVVLIEPGLEILGLISEDLWKNIFLQWHGLPLTFAFQDFFYCQSFLIFSLFFFFKK